MLSRKSDEELMTAYQWGDSAAFDELYRRHAPKVLGFLRQRCRNEARARDLFQASFLKLHRFRSRYDSALPFLPWLFTICRNELIDASRRASERQEIPTEQLPEPPQPAPEAAVRDLPLDRLPEAQRSALELRYRNEFSFEEIATRLGTSPANARQLVSRALRFLRGAHGK